MRIACVVLVCGSVLQPSWVQAQSGDNVAVVINNSSAESRTIGEAYVSRRGIPASNVFRIETSLNEVIDRDTFTNSIEWPLRTLISRRGLQDRVLYIVLTKGVPLRISGATEAFGAGASVDSELTLLYRRMVGTYVPVVGYVENPYFLKDGNIASARPFTHRDHDIFLVSRLDGFSVDDVLTLIDRGSSPSKVALQSLSATSPPVPTAAAASTRFAAGAIVAGVPPYSASTFREPSPKATPPRSATNGPSAIAVADLVRQGVTGAAGEASHTDIRNPIETGIVVPAYLAGASVAEAFYLAMPYLSASTVVVGDPLCAPSRQRSLTRADIEAAIDPDSALPGLFADRRLTAMSADLPYVPRLALALTVRAAMDVDAGDPRGARALLEQATAIAPLFGTAQFNLGSLYEMAGEYDLAIDRYRRTLEALPPMARAEMGGIFGRASATPIRVAALNNLAYVLAVHRHKPAEALPLASKAVKEAPNEPSALDTLAWIEYLLGDTTIAVTHIRAALASGPSSAVIALHAASILSKSGAHAEAEMHLKEALRLQPDLAGSADTTRIRAQLHESAAPVSPE